MTLLQDRYELQERLGAGGMAKVFRAFDRTLSRRVAVKMLHDDLVDNEELRQRFLREARVFARLRHPAIVEIHDVVQGEKAAAMVMEFVEGSDLAHLARRVPLRLPELALCLMRPVLDALAHAHTEGVIHRDVKPANILLSKDGRVKLGDFGIAKVLEETHLTQTGEFLGTPAYIAPEQAKGEDITPAVDQYACGVVLYELLGGRPPFTGPTPLAVLSQILIGKFPDVRELNPAVDERLAGLVHRTLSANPAERFENMAALIAAVDAYVPPLSAARERQIVTGLLDDPTPIIASVARSVADSRVTTARQHLAAGEVEAARAAAREALLRQPEHPEAKEMLDTLRHSAAQLVALPRGPRDTEETDLAVPTTAPSRWKLGLGAAGAAVLVAAAVITLTREPPPVAEPVPTVAVAAVVEPPPPRLSSEAPSAEVPPSDPPPPASQASAPTTEPPAPASSHAGSRPRPAAPRSETIARPASAAPAAESAAPSAAPNQPADTPGHLRIVTTPWADVEVDGRVHGRTPYLKLVDLPPGEHRLVLRNPGFPPYTETIRIVPGQILSRRVNLNTSETPPSTP